MLVRVGLVLLSWCCSWSWTRAYKLRYDSWTVLTVSSGVCHYGNSVDCCWGWRLTHQGRCQPHCQQGCKHGECVGPDRCKCSPGYTGKACNQDLNECGLKPRPCKYRCMNTLGSYKCYCADGYTQQADGSCRNARTCYHANCQYGCEVMKGAVRCTCPSPGLRLGPDRRTCVDIDECASGAAVCPRRRKCVNTFGSFFCRCHLGFKLTYINGKYSCIDKDPRTFCTLNPTSPKCKCKDGHCKAIPNVSLEPKRPKHPTWTPTEAWTIRTTAAPPTTTRAVTVTTTTSKMTTNAPTTTTTSTTTTTPATTTATTTTSTTPTPTTSTTTPTPTTSITTPTPTTSTTPIPTTTTTPTPTVCTTTSTPTTTTRSTTTSAAPLPTTITTSTTTLRTTPTTISTTIPTTTTTTTTPAPTTVAATTTTIARTTPLSTTTTPFVTTTERAATPTTLSFTTPVLSATTTFLMTTGTQHTQRQRGDVHIPRHPGHNQVWEFDVELGNTADDNKDDPAAGVFHCSFDQGVCGWMSDKEGDLHWETTTDAAGGRYLSVPELKAGQMSVRGARLSVPIGPPLSNSDLCFSFSHWLTGHHVGVLQLFVKRRGRDHSRYSHALWSRTGRHGWRHTEVTLKMHSVEKVLLKAERRRGQRGQIAIDDVTLRRGACE